MLVDRTFADITSSRIGHLNRSESMEKWSDEEYRCSHFFDEFIVDIIHPHLSHIHMKNIACKIDLYIETLDDFEERKDISNAWNIMEGNLIEKETRCNGRETGILRSTDFDGPGETLSSLDFEHGILNNEKNMTQ